MAPLDQHPHHIRRRIALMGTGIVALILLLLLVLVYTNKKEEDGPNSAGERAANFYTTIIQGAQSYFQRD
jgi:hypothetical protein